MIKLEEWEKIGKLRLIITEEIRFKQNQEELERLLALMEGNEGGEVTWFEVAVLGLFPISSRIEEVLLTLVKHQDSKVRARALSILVRESTEPKIRELVLQALNDSDKVVILEALESIQLKGEDWQDLSSQIQPFLHHPDDKIKIEALVAFASMHRKNKVWHEISHRFQSFLQHPDRRIRSRALFKLGWLYWKNKKWKNMKNLFKLISNNSIKYSILYLINFPNPNKQIKKMILQGLDDPDPTVIVKILSTIDRVNLYEFRPQIRKLLRHPNGKVRAEALRVLDSLWRGRFRYHCILRDWETVFIYYPLLFIEKLRLKPVILRALSDPDEMVIVRGLSIIDEEKWRSFYTRIKSLLQHPSGNVRAKGFSVLYPFYVSSYERSKLTKDILNAFYVFCYERFKWIKRRSFLRLKRPTNDSKELIMQMLKDSHESVSVQVLSSIYDQLKRENRKERIFEFFDEQEKSLWEDVHHQVMPLLNHPHENVRVEVAKVLGELLRRTEEEKLISEIEKYVEEEKSDRVKFYIYKALFDISKKTVYWDPTKRPVDCNKEYFKRWVDLIHSPSSEVRRMVLFEFENSLAGMDPLDYRDYGLVGRYQYNAVQNTFCLQYLSDVLQQQLNRESDPIIVYFIRKLLKKVKKDYEKYREYLRKKREYEMKHWDELIQRIY